MSEQPTTSILRRMLAQDEPVAAEVPLTVARALRLSAARAAEKSVGLKLTVRSVSEEMLALDALIERLSNELLLLKMQKEGEPAGIAAMDTGLVAAIVESQTMGKLIDAKPNDRPMTAVDASLAEPLIAGLMKELNETIGGTVLEGWPDDFAQKGQFLDLRQIGLTLPNETYRLLEMTIDLSVAEREGKFFFALPIPKKVAAPVQPVEEGLVWEQAFPETVGASLAELPVILHRFDAPLFQLEKMEVGQVFELPKCRVDRARLEMPDGTLIAKGRLGQLGGHLALRLVTPEPDILQELDGGAAPAIETTAAPMLAPEPEMPIFDADPDLGGLDIGDDAPEAMDLSDLGSEQEVDLGSLGEEPEAEMDLSSLGDFGGAEDTAMDLSGLGTEDDDVGAEVDLSNIDLGSLGTE